MVPGWNEAFQAYSELQNERDSLIKIIQGLNRIIDTLSLHIMQTGEMTEEELKSIKEAAMTEKAASEKSKRRKTDA